MPHRSFSDTPSAAPPGRGAAPLGVAPEELRGTPAPDPRAPLGLRAEFGELFRTAFLDGFRAEFLAAFDGQFLADLRRAYDELPRGAARRGLPGTEGYRMASWLAFGSAWDKAFPPAFKGTCHAVLFQPRPPTLRRGFLREFRTGLVSRFAVPFRSEMFSVLARAYGDLPGAALGKVFRRNFDSAFRMSFGTTFMRAFRTAYP
jgi:hypothetical protein